MHRLECKTSEEDVKSAPMAVDSPCISVRIRGSGAPIASRRTISGLFQNPSLIPLGNFRPRKY